MERVTPVIVQNAIGKSIDFVYQFGPLADSTVVLGKMTMLDLSPFQWNIKE